MDETTDPVELGVTLLANFEDAELSMAEAVDRLETITTDPHLTREILDTAERQGAASFYRAAGYRETGRRQWREFELIELAKEL